MATINEKNKEKWTKDRRHWYFYVRYDDEFGKKKAYKSKMFFTKAEAEEAEATFKKKLKYGENANTNALLEDVTSEWLSYKKQLVKSSTFYGLYKKVHRYIIPKFESLKLSSIKIPTLNNWRDYIVSLKMSDNYKNIIIGYFKEILNYAVENYNFDIKIANKLHKIKSEAVISNPKNSKLNFWTYKEFCTFIKNVDDELYYTLFNFMYFTGVRFGEMNALNWKDIDLTNKKLIINKTLTTDIVGGGYAITTPKTANSNRTVDLDDNLVTLLKRHYEYEKKIYSFNKDMFIFGNIRFLSSTTFKRNLNKYIEKTNEKIDNENDKIKKITPHGFRHSHASLLINLGCDSREVAERLGDTVQVIEETYSHMFPEKKKNTVNVLNSLNS